MRRGCFSPRLSSSLKTIYGAWLEILTVVVNRSAEALAARSCYWELDTKSWDDSMMSPISAAYGLNIRCTRCSVNIHMQLAMDSEATGPVIIAALQTEHAPIDNHSIRDEVADGSRSPAAGVVTSQTCGMHRHKAPNR